MNHIEDELKKALKRTDAPDSLLPKIMERLPVESGTTPARERGRLIGWLRSPWLRWVTATCAAGVVLIVAALYFQVIAPDVGPDVSGTPSEAEQSQLEQGLKAKQDLLLALHITSEKLGEARRAVTDIQN